MIVKKKRFWPRLVATCVAIAASMSVVSAANAADSRDGDMPRSGDSIVGPHTSPPAGYGVATGAGFEWYHTIGSANTHWLGALNVGNGLEWCTNLDSSAPVGSGSLVTGVSPNPAPGVLGDLTVSNAEMGWIFKNYEPFVTNGTHNGAITAAAISTLVHANYETGSGRGYVQPLILDVMQSSDPAIRTRAQEMVAAARVAGVADVIPGEVVVSDDQMSFTIEGIGVKNKNGGWLAGVPFTATITDGAAVFSNGSKSIDLTSTNAAQSLSGHATGTGKITVEYRFRWSQMSVALRERVSTQTTLKFDPGNPEVRQGKYPTFDLIFDFQPLVSSQVGAQFLTAGDDFVDAITVEADKSYVNPEWTVVDGKPVPVKAVTSVYYAGIVKPTVGEAVPENAVKIGEATSTHNGPGTQNISVPTKGLVGYYVAKTTITKADQGDFAKYIHADATYQYGLGNETSISQINPTVTTKASDKLLLPGDVTSDAVTVQLGVGEVWADGLTIKADGTLYGPFDMPLPQSSTVPAGAPVAATASLEFTENNQTLDAPWTAGEPGFYTWRWGIDKDAQVNPDLFAQSFIDDFMIHVETSSVRIPELSHYSLAREYNVHANGLAFDTITIGGYMPSHQQWGGDDYWVPDNLEAHVRVYDAGANPDWSSAEVPEGTPVHWETTVEAVNGVFEIGYDSKNPITGFTPGHHYVFHYEFDGDDRVAPFTSDFNDIRERFYVPGELPLTPSTATQAVDEVMVGEDFYDTALVSGDVPAGAYLVFEAFGPQNEGDAPTCEEPFFTSKKISVSGSGYYKSGNTKVTKPGLVYWVETLFDKDGKVLHKGKCGIPSETTKVIPYEPTISTKALLNEDGTVQDQLFASWKTPEGYDATDPAVTPWPYPVGAKTTVELFYAAPGEALTCSAEQKLDEDTFDLVEGKTKYLTKKFAKGAEAGTWGFVETTRPPTTTCPPEPVEPPICPPEGEIPGEPGEPGEPCEPGQPVPPEPCDPDPDPEPVSKGECGDPDETIIIAPLTPPPGLAQTGAATTGLIVGAGVLVGAGIALWRLSRKNRG